MKRFVLTLLLLGLMHGFSSAQMRIGVSAAYEVENSCRFGVDFELPLEGRWSFVPGVYYSLRNSEWSNCDERSDTEHYNSYGQDKAHFITVPLRFSRRQCKPGKVKFVTYLQFGGYVALGLGGTSKVDRYNAYYKRDEWDGYGKPQQILVEEESHWSTGAFGRDGSYKGRIDIGQYLGFSFVIKKHYQFGVFEEIGFCNIKNGHSWGVALSNIDQIHGTLGVNVGYIF